MLQFLLQVQFIGEEGEDLGGLRRELFSLLLERIKERYLEGQLKQLVLRHDVVALQVSLLCVAT